MEKRIREWLNFLHIGEGRIIRKVIRRPSGTWGVSVRYYSGTGRRVMNFGPPKTGRYIPSLLVMMWARGKMRNLSMVVSGLLILSERGKTGEKRYSLNYKMQVSVSFFNVLRTSDRTSKISLKTWEIEGTSHQEMGRLAGPRYMEADRALPDSIPLVWLNSIVFRNFLCLQYSVGVLT